MKKLIVLVYGLVSYVVFLGAFLYAIAFAGNFFLGEWFVPKTIDSGPEGDLVTSLLINAGLLGVFAVQHSIMARPAFKAWWTKIIGTAAERSTFVMATNLALILLYWQWQPIRTEVWMIENELFANIMWGICFVGWLIVFLSTWMINHFELLGLQQIYFNMKNVESRPPNFQVRFFYKFVRHPLMVGFIIAFWATPYMTLGHLIFALATTGYIVIAVAMFEEKDLKDAIGKDYENYQKEVPMFIPFTK